MADDLLALSGTTVPLLRAADAPNTTRAQRTGSLVRVDRGVYAPAAEWAALPPWEKYRVRVRAAALKHPDAVFGYEAAASLHGLPVFGDPGEVHVLSDPAGRSRVSGGVTVHTTVEPRQIETIGATLTTSAADTVVDIARGRHEAVGLAVADAALRRDPTLTVEQLVAMNEQRPSSRGRRRARWVLHRATRHAESPLESVDRAVIEWLGFPEPELQKWIGADRVDKWWPEYRIAGEGDGDLKYAGSSDDARRLLSDRHERDARLFSNGVRAVPHWGWPEAIAAQPLNAMLLTAGLPLVQPPNTAALFTLRRVLSRSTIRENPTS